VREHIRAAFGSSAREKKELKKSMKSYDVRAGRNTCNQSLVHRVGAGADSCVSSLSPRHKKLSHKQKIINIKRNQRGTDWRLRMEESSKSTRCMSLGTIKNLNSSMKYMEFKISAETPRTTTPRSTSSKGTKKLVSKYQHTYNRKTSFPIDLRKAGRGAEGSLSANPSTRSARSSRSSTPRSERNKKLLSVSYS